LTIVSKNKVLALFGPTACGKTALLERLFTGPQRLLPFDAGIVSADSIQIYRGLDIGSAKPEATLLQNLPHALIDIRDPQESFSLGDFVQLADQACRNFIAEGRVPVLSGGTAYYIKAFIYGLPTAPPADLAVRAALQAELAATGAEILRTELQRVDPLSYTRIAPADHYRLLRALEVFRSSGRPLSSYELPTMPRPDWDVVPVAIDRPREELYRRIDTRVQQLLAAGLPAEIAVLRASGYDQATPAMKGIGYSEFFDPSLSGLQPEAALAAVREAIALHSRRYAKRQLTFMRALPGVSWFPAEAAEQIAEYIRRTLWSN